MDVELYRAHARLERSHWWFAGRRAVVAAVIERWVGTGPVGPVLDLGCGTGGMLPLLARYGPVTAVEPEPLAAEHARGSSPAADVRLGKVPADVPDDGRFALVTAFDVIEHLDDDVGALRAARAAVRSGGAVVVTVPALGWLWSEHDVVNHHRRRYSRRRLAAAVVAAGLDLRHASYFNLALLPPIAAVRLAGRVRRPSRPPRSDFDLRLPPSLANRALAGLLAAERSLVAGPGLPLGVSLVAVARRP